jgi:hypothetical protein
LKQIGYFGVLTVSASRLLARQAEVSVVTGRFVLSIIIVGLIIIRASG